MKVVMTDTCQNGEENTIIHEDEKRSLRAGATTEIGERKTLQHHQPRSVLYNKHLPYLRPLNLYDIMSVNHKGNKLTVR